MATAITYPPIIGVSGSTATIPAQNLDLNSVVSIVSGSADPTSVATSAPAGSLYLRTNGNCYLKQDAGSSTNWLQTNLLSLSGSTATLVAQNLNLNSVVSLISGSVDPSSVATSAPKGSLYLSTNGGHYIKQDAGSSTNWSLIGLANAVINHIIGNGVAPTIAANAGAGTGGTASITGSDIAGQITVGAGTLPTAAVVAATITFNSAYASTPVVVLTPANAVTALLGGVTGIFLSSTTAGFTLTAGATALSGSTTYLWNYMVMQP